MPLYLIRRPNNAALAEPLRNSAGLHSALISAASPAAAITAANVEIAALQANLPPSLVQVTRTLGQAKQFRDAVREYERDAPVLAIKRAKLAKLNRWKTFITGAAQAFATAEAALANARIADRPPIS